MMLAVGSLINVVWAKAMCKHFYGTNSGYFALETAVAAAVDAAAIPKHKLYEHWKCSLHLLDF